MPDSQIKQATLRDVADMAGVSYQTVWRVVNEHPHVAVDTRERVLQAVRVLDYRPHRAAQVLTTGRSYILQLVIFEYAYGDPLPAILHWAREFGYTMVVTELKDATSTEAVRATLRETAQMIDGLLMVMPYPHLSYEALAELCQGRPFVVVNTELGAKMPSVVFDQRHGTRQAVEHLVALGHRLIAEISGPLDNCDAQARHETWMSMAERYGLDARLSVAGDFETCSGYGAAKRLLGLGQPFTAVLVGNDLMALGALRAFDEAGLRVPEDISVVGYDDVDVAAYLSPPLTTVRQEFDILGRESVEYLVSLIEDARTPIQQRVLYPELIVRQSTRSLNASPVGV
ncbi:MAG: substrate-binding domain-containing protein [Anaerolineae bacterium]|jgi:DNA-binding LacI/PurR family transcriptional regulator|nr:substrate-binding domain-containing protein [Anaerolineae bacterium]